MIVLNLIYTKTQKYANILKSLAEVVEWYTRATQNRMPYGLWVQVPPSAQKS